MKFSTQTTSAVCKKYHLIKELEIEEVKPADNRVDKLRGLILGTAVGDSLGLPAEGLSRSKIKALGWTNWKHRFFFGRGMVSDDTEHTFFVTQALITHPDHPEHFKASLAWKFRLWLLSVPAGIGFGTLKAILKLWLFIPLSKSGVFTAGNGPAMRSAVIGAYFADNTKRMLEYVRASTELTHRDPRAFVGAAAISYAAAVAMTNGRDELPDAAFFKTIKQLSEPQDEQWPKLVEQMERSLKEGLSLDDFVVEMGQGESVSGFIYHTVPIAIYAWLRYYGDFATTLTAVLNCGGDTDTTGAIAAALAGATVGETGIPDDWINNILEWPRSVRVLRKAADTLADVNNSPSKPVKYFWPGVVVRNIFMVIVIFGHIFLRALPLNLRRLIRI